MRNLLALLLLVPSLCLAQLPDHVPLENLRGWYPLDGNVLDFSGNDHHGLNIGVTFTFDRNGEMNKAGDFDGLSSHITGNISSWTPTEESTLSLWLHPRGDAGGQPYDLFFQLGEYGNHTFAYGYNYNGENLDLYSNCHWNPYYSVNINNEWHHLAIVDDATESSIFLDGALLHSWSSGSSSWCYQGSSSFLIGGGADNQYTTGYIDDVGIWNRALTEQEIAQLYEGSSLTFGCTDPAACNYDATVEGDDGSCEYGCLYCGENTFWDSALQQCVTIAPPCAPSCGEGTVWDPVNEECIIAIPADLNYDGCVTVNDLLVLLAVHGTCPPYPEWPDEPNDSGDCPPGAFDQLQQDLNGEGWSWLGEYNTAQYFVSTNPISWDNAQSLAVAYGGHLVVIDSQDENDWISTSVGDEYVWIGLYQDTSSAEYSEPAGGWAWVNGAEVTYSNWAGNAPNEVNGLENACQMYSNGLWNDAPGDYFLNGSDGRDIYAVIEFSSACPTPDWTCGAPLTYWDYDYATVLIGDQCWFAENLRNGLYSNGDTIPLVLDNDQWLALGNDSTGGTAFYANNELNRSVFGALYNGFAVLDARSLCPDNWDVPSDLEWQTLETQLGMPSNELTTETWRGNAENVGHSMKVTAVDSPPWNGTNASFWNGLPAGYRHPTGTFNSLQSIGLFWSTDLVPGANPLYAYLFARQLSSQQTGIKREREMALRGFSVRCIKD